MSDIVIFTSINDEEKAMDMITEMLMNNLIISGVIFPGVKLMYKWEGKINLDEEYKIMLKAKEEKCCEIENYIAKNHPYLVPEIIKIQASFGSENFWEIIKSKTKK